MGVFYIVIQVSNIDKSYGQQVIFRKAAFTLNPGERAGLVGRNGQGKTTLIRMLCGQEHPDSGTISSPKDYRIGHLSQHIRFSTETVLKEACLSLPPSEDGSDESYKAETVLAGLGFAQQDVFLPPSNLSGGFQVRLSLAKVLISNPDLLLLDEPTNYLDILSLRWLSKFLKSWQKELIIITHDRAFMDNVTTHTMAIHRCGIRKVAGPTEKVYQQLLMEEETLEKTRINDEKKRKEVEQFINRFRAKATKARAVQSRMKALKRKVRPEAPPAMSNLDFAFPAAPFTGRHLMEISDLSFGFDPKEAPLIAGLSFYIEKRDRIGVIGRNGKGKTTLLNLLAEELSPLGGKVRCHRDLKLAYFGQTNIDRLHPEKTVEEEIMDVRPDQHRGKARSICGVMMFPGNEALKKISVLSGGERSRVLLGKLLVRPSNMLLLDEPTNHLDMESTESLIEAVDDYDGAVIIVTHSEMILNAVATRLIVFDGERVVFFHGTYRDFLDRVGWKDEDAPTPSENQANVVAPSHISRKDMRRIRAELIREKSKTLGTLQQRMKRIEDEIISLEEQSDRDNRDLLEASHKGDGATIRRCAKSLHEAKVRIESLFPELEQLHGKFDRQKRDYDEKLRRTY